jgi:hypothetical protein
MHTRQWIGTYAGQGNGDYLGELTRALQSITTYLRRFALTTEVAFVRLDGQYGDTVAMAQLLEAGMYFVTRARGYHVLEHPQIQGVLAHPPTASVTRVNSDEVVELFDGGWLQLDAGLSQTRVIVARHPLPAPGKRASALGSGSTNSSSPPCPPMGSWSRRYSISTMGEELIAGGACG